MNDEKFSPKARRTTRILLRIPVHLAMEEGGQAQFFDAWTMIVNIHGAKIECGHAFQPGDEVLIQVPSNGKSQKGKVIAGTLDRNDNGNYEFAVELEDSEDLWGVGFPRSDGKPRRIAIPAATVEASDYCEEGAVR